MSLNLFFIRAGVRTQQDNYAACKAIGFTIRLCRVAGWLEQSLRNAVSIANRDIENRGGEAHAPHKDCQAQPQ